MVIPYKDRFNKEQQNTITDIIDRIGNSNNAEGVDLMILFDYWKISFPTVKMELNCGSCRKAVIKFFKQVRKEINGDTTE